MKYNFHETDREMQSVLASIVCSLSKKEFEKVDSSAIDIELKIEGKEIDFIKFIRRYFVQLDRMAKEEAMVVLKKQLGDVNDILYEIGTYLKEKLTEVEF